MATVGPFISALGEDAIHYSRTLGGRDAETRWPVVGWNTLPIKVMVKPLAALVRDTPQGRIVESRARLYTGTPVALRDRLIYAGEFWEVEDVRFVHPLLGGLGYYHATIIRLDNIAACFDPFCFDPACFVTLL